MYVQTWQAIGAAGVWARHNYVVKVDADAVFFANKLVEALRGMAVPAEGVYLENCPFVEDCYAGLNWKVGIKNGKYGPMGEDLFAQTCMDRHGVKKVERFDLPCGSSEGREEEQEVRSLVQGNARSLHPPLQETRCLLQVHGGS